MEGVIVILFLAGLLVYEVYDEKLLGWKKVKQVLTKKKKSA